MYLFVLCIQFIYLFELFIKVICLCIYVCMYLVHILIKLIDLCIYCIYLFYLFIIYIYIYLFNVCI